MRLLLLHNQYKIRGGEDTVVESEIDLLRQHGHIVETVIESNESIHFLNAIKIGMQAVYSNHSKNLIRKKIKSFKPDLVHVHNFFPKLSPSIYDACIAEAVPVVQTLHNFRTICANGIFLREGKSCELCLKGNAYQGFLHACYRDSHLASFPVARMIQAHRNKDTWNTKVNQFIALSNFSKNKFIEAGFSPEKISTKSNFLADPLASGAIAGKENFAVYVGRLSDEKGLHTLMKAWKNISFPLKIIGDGPLLQKLQSYDNPQVKFLGKKSQADVFAELRKAAFLVLPSECYENFPMSIAEAFAHGCPVLCSAYGSMNELVDDGVTGLKFSVGNIEDLRVKIQQVIEDSALRKTMGEKARQKYLDEFTPDENYTQLIEIYKRCKRCGPTFGEDLRQNH